MDLQSFDFNFRLLDIVDILLVAVILYYVYSLIRGTIAVNILIGLGLIYVIYLLVKQFNMHLLTEIFGGFISVGSLALVVVFQQEIRRFLIHIGKNRSEEHTSELQSLMRISYAVVCLKKKNKPHKRTFTKSTQR